MKGNWITMKGPGLEVFMARVGAKQTVKCRSVEKMCPLIPAVGSSWLFVCPTENRGKTALLLMWLELEPKPGNLAEEWAIDHVTGKRTTHRQARKWWERAQAEARWGERRVIEGKPASLILRVFLSLPDFLSPSVALALTWLSLARPLTLVQLLLLPLCNNRNLQK